MLDTSSFLSIHRIVDYFIRIMYRLYELFIQFGDAGFASFENQSDPSVAIGPNIFASMITGPGSDSFVKDIYPNFAVQSAMSMLYSVVCYLPQTVGEGVTFLVNLVFKAIGIGEIPFVNFGDFPMIIAIAMALPFWIGILALIKLLVKIWEAMPVL